MKKLLVITDLFPNKFNPFSEVFVQHQVNELSKYYEVRVIATSYYPRYFIEYKKYRDYYVEYIYLPYIRYVYLSRILTYRMFAIPHIRKIIINWKPDILHIHDCRHVPELYYLHDCLNQFVIPRFLTLHNIRTHPVMIRSQCFKWFYKMCVRKAYNGWNHIFTVNDKIKKIIAKETINTTVTNIGNAIGEFQQVDSSLLDPYKKILSDGSFKLISVGNLLKEKGFDILIEAVASLIRKGYRIQLVIVGKGKEKDKLQSLCSRLDITKQVYFTGAVNNKIVRNLYPLFDAFVLASYSETFGVVYIEAMYAGIPSIGVTGQGIDGVIKDGVNGLLIKERDINDLSRKLEFLINNKDRALAIAQKGQKLVKSEFLMPLLIQKIMKEYEK